MARVLIVDDEPALLRSFSRLMGQDGHDVVSATDGGAAVGLLDGGRFDVVLSDVMMPGLDGLALLRAIRQRDPDVPVILMTANATLATAQEAMEHGALRYMEKPVDPDDLRQVIQKAVRLHQIARMKRAALEYLGASAAERIGDRAGLEASFARALEQLWLAVQPIVDWRERRIFGYEALLRSNEPSLPDPGALLAAAERLGRVAEVGRCVRLRAAALAAELPAGVSLFVNMHAHDLADDELYAAGAALSRHASRVVLEVTERASLDGIDDLGARAAELRGLGYRIAVDDLGAGYAGLTTLANLEPEVVKLDMTLVRNVHAEPTKQKLVRSLVGLCSDLGVRIIAEGVEHADERDVLISLGCDLLQGYLFARPRPPFPTVEW